jgi:hypothetical protein
MKAILSGVVFLSVLLGQAVSAEERATLGPSLDETVRFLRSALPSRIIYTVYGHDVTVGTNTAVRRSFELAVTTADPDRCFIGVRYRFDNGKIGRASEKTADIDLKEVEAVTFRPLVEVVQEVDDSQGHPEHRVKIDPPVFLVLVKASADLVMFNFYDEAVAQGVTKALQHAAELCSAGQESNDSDPTSATALPVTQPNTTGQVKANSSLKGSSEPNN